MPPPINLDTVTHGLLTLLAKAWGTTPETAVRLMLEQFSSPTPEPRPTTDPPLSSVPVHGFYAGVRIDAHYDPICRSVTIRQGVAAGTYKTPSGASSAVITALNPKVKPNRTGWSFWRINATNQYLQTLRSTSYPPAAQTMPPQAPPGPHR